MSNNVCENKEDCEEREEYNFCTVQPTFIVKDWSMVNPIMADFVSTTRTEPGCIYYGWTKDGNTLFCREAYKDGDAVNAHLANVGGHIGEILKHATLDSISIHGPANELEKCKPGTKDLGTKYFSVDSGFAHFDRSKDVGYDFCIIQPTFTVNDWSAVEPIMADFVSATRSEPDCVYYGWTRDGNTLCCREAYKDGDAVNAHLDNVGGHIGEILKYATLDDISIHGPTFELEKCKPNTQELGTKYFSVDSGFINIK